MILPCSCKHPFQDQRYGLGQRVHNQKKDGARRCTVCGNVKTPSRQEPRPAPDARGGPEPGAKG